MSDNFIIRPGLAIPHHEVWYEFSHSSGPGGQNVNKVASAVSLCFHPESSAKLLPWHKEVIARKLGNRINADGVLRITCDEGRSQSGNRAKVAERFCLLLADALRPTKIRRPTRPSRMSKERRLLDKRFRAARKTNRQKYDDWNDA